MIGIVKHSKVPLRLMAFLGFGFSFLSFLAAVMYFILKLIFWEEFTLGMAPIIISIFFLASIQLFCMGVLGEYIGAIYTRVNKKPIVVEKEKNQFLAYEKNLAQTLESNKIFKLVLGLGNQDFKEIENLVEIYAKAGADMFDINPSREAVETVLRTIEKTGRSTDDFFLYNKHGRKRGQPRTKMFY